MKALVVGGTGPTGPFLVKGLQARGYTVTILHRGTHEIPEIGPEVEHIHADPHFRETLDTALAGRNFDLVLATYGRIRFVAEATVGKTARFISIGGVPCYRGYYHASANFPAGMPVPIPEDAPLVDNEAEERFGYLIATTEQAVLRCHPNAAIFRYPYVYGPYQLVPREWSVVRRILDRRKFILLPNDGLALMTHGYAENLAHAVLLAVDQPQASAGQAYNCGDEIQFTMRQLVEVIARAMNYQLEIISVPAGLPLRAGAMTPVHHGMVDIFKLKHQLGYRDVVSTLEAVKRTIQWYLDHPLERGGDMEQRLLDPFDYAAEDRLASIAREYYKQMAAVEVRKPGPSGHPYPHPKEPGLARDHRNR
ncbi:MAG: NAD-dependent epimerase/dehydratase family protein [Candidatus Binataceae bacterium]